MASATLLPNGTVQNSGSLHGTDNPPTVHSALSDSSGNSWVRWDAGESSAVTMTDLALPAGGVITRVASLFRLNWNAVAPITVPPVAILDVFLGSGHSARSTTTVGWTTATWVYGPVIDATATSAITDGQVDAAQMAMAAQYASSVDCYDVAMVVIYVSPPTMNITAPTGTLTVDTSPTVTWTTTLDADGGPQTHFEVEILDGATVVTESGLIGSAAQSWDIPVSLPDDTYTARVRIAQTVAGNQMWTAWDTQAFTIDVPSPGTPGLTLTPQAAQGRIKVDITDNPGSTSTTFFIVERSADGAVNWDVVRANNPGGLITPVGGGTTVYDYDAPNGVLCDYRVHAIHWFFTDGILSSSSSGYDKDAAMWVSDEWWLKHPTRPSLNFHPRMRSAPSQSQASRQGVHYVLNRRDPVVVADARSGWTGEVSIRSDNDLERQSLDDMLEDGQPLLLQAPSTAYWDDVYMAIGNHERSRPIDTEWSPLTFDTFTWTAVRPPTSQLEE